MRTQLLLAFGLVLAIALAVNAAAYLNTVKYREAALWVRHSETVIDSAQQAHLTVEDLDNRYREFLLRGSRATLRAYRQDISNARTQLDELSQLTADNPPQAVRWQRIAGLVDRMVTDIYQPGIALREQLPNAAAPDQAIIAFDHRYDQRQAIDEIAAEFDAGVQEERDLMVGRTSTVAAGNALLLNVLVAGTLLTIIAGLVVAILFANRLGSAMQRLAGGAQAVASGDLGRRINLERGDEIGAVALAFDRMAAALQQDRAEREAIERLKDEFVSVVSHELRTPLTSIRGSLGLLHAGLLGPISSKAERMLDVALSNTDRLIRLINDILDIERMQSGQVPMQMGPTNAQDMVRRSVESLKSLADDAQVRLVEQAESMELTADPDRIVQTLTNLISNAIKFSPGDSRIEIRARRSGHEALFSVADQGRGIPPDKLEAIFGRFEQVDTSDAREKGGTGLGLAISRSIVNLHGGRIWVESTLGKGSTFYFTLPLPMTLASLQPADFVGGRAAPHILVVDDDPSVIEVISRMLAGEGYWPVGARSGEEALDKARADVPAAILLDLAMPNVSGWDVLAQLKAEPATCEIPVVIMSGLERVRDDRTEQTDGWLAKPVTSDALRRMVDRVTADRDGPAHVLIVEDDADLARVLSESFLHWGLETEVASSSAQAIELSQRRPPDLLLLDLALGDGDGFQVVDWFRENDRLRRLPIVVYTARDLSISERDRLQLGHTEFVTKGRMTPEDVQRRVLRIVQRVVPARGHRAA